MQTLPREFPNTAPFYIELSQMLATFNTLAQLNLSSMYPFISFLQNSNIKNPTYGANK